MSIPAMIAGAEAFTPSAMDGPAAKRKAQGSELDEETLRKLGVDICNEIEHSETGKGSLPKRWDKNEQLYNIDPQATNLNLVEGMASYPIPLWKPKADRIIGTVFKSMTAIEPYVQIVPDSEDPNDTDKATRLEKALMTVATAETGKYGFDRALRQCLKTAVNTGIAIFYMHPMTDGSVLSEAIHPRDFCIYPHELGSIKAAKTIGHRYWKLRSEIQSAYEAGEYLTDEVGGSHGVGERGGKSADFGRTVDTPTNHPSDELIECWQVVRRCDLDGEEKEWLVTVTRMTQKVLRVVPFEYTSGRMYFDIRFDDEYGSFWPASSPGQDIQGIQLIYSDLFNVAIQGGYSTAFPGVAIIGATLNSKVKRWGPGTVWELPSGADVKIVGNAFDGKYLVDLIPKVEEIADATSRISRLGVSQALPSSTTATAAAGMLEAQDEGKDQYSDFVAPAIGEIFVFLREILLVHYTEITAKHKNLGLQGDEVVLKGRFIPTGKTSTTSPTQLLNKLRMALELAEKPISTLDYAEVEDQVMQMLDFPFDVAGLKKKGPSSMEWIALVMGFLQGQVTIEELAQIAQEAQAGITQQDPSGGVPPGGQQTNGAGGGVPGGPENTTLRAVS